MLEKSRDLCKLSLFRFHSSPRFSNFYWRFQEYYVGCHLKASMAGGKLSFFHHVLLHINGLCILGNPGTVGRDKSRDERFRAWAEELLGTDSQQTISKRSGKCWLPISHQKGLVLLCPIGKRHLLSFFYRKNANFEKHGYQNSVAIITSLLTYTLRRL